MTISNPNRFVTGLSDISYVKQVNRKEIPRFPGQITVMTPDVPLIVQDQVIVEDKFVPDTFTPEDLPDNVPDDTIG